MYRLIEIEAYHTSGENYIDRYTATYRKVVEQGAPRFPVEVVINHDAPPIWQWEIDYNEEELYIELPAYAVDRDNGHFPILLAYRPTETPREPKRIATA